MRDTAMLGVIGTGRIRQCVECREAAGVEGFECTGFGVGCFLPRAKALPQPREPLQPLQPRFIFRKPKP